MVVRLETNNGRKSLGLNRRKQSLPNHLITTNRKRTRFCHVLLMRNSLSPFKRICTISDHWGAYLILSICQKLAMEIMATNLPPTQLFSTEISTYSLTLRAHEPGEMNWSQELTYIHSTSCFIVFRKMFRKETWIFGTGDFALGVASMSLSSANMSALLFGVLKIDPDARLPRGVLARRDSSNIFLMQGWGDQWGRHISQLIIYAS